MPRESKAPTSINGERTVFRSKSLLGMGLLLYSCIWMYFKEQKKVDHPKRFFYSKIESLAVKASLW